ncbi:unnamed protein product [Pleuronectes platessa]|uniref:Uncharacterized protein n=1 Tax=Pleuronectes platessa TaxID=8262 RepID=A0A9N7TZM1_PLEPL|nr:unnamed protein product [Pleuronectes platessa]
MEAAASDASQSLGGCVLSRRSIDLGGAVESPESSSFWGTGFCSTEWEFKGEYMWHQPGADILPAVPLAAPAPSVICMNICKPKLQLWRELLSIACGSELDYRNKITTICSLSTMQGYNLKDYSPMKPAPASVMQSDISHLRPDGLVPERKPPDLLQVSEGVCQLLVGGSRTGGGGSRTGGGVRLVGGGSRTVLGGVGLVVERESYWLWGGVGLVSRTGGGEAVGLVEGGSQTGGEEGVGLVCGRESTGGGGVVLWWGAVGLVEGGVRLVVRRSRTGGGLGVGLVVGTQLDWWRGESDWL